MDLSQIYALFIDGLKIGGLLSTIPFIVGYVIDALLGVFNK